MIRERVSTRGVIRPLEPEEDLTAFALPPDLVGVVSELAMRRYLDGKSKFDKKFHKRSTKIAKKRRHNLETAKKDALKNMTQLQTYLEDEKRAHGGPPEKFNGVHERLLSSGSWSWAWALDVDEHPPSSSIVSRRDTGEAVRLARIADQSVLAEEHIMSGNNLWSMIVNFLTVTPEKKHHHPHHEAHEEKEKTSEEKTRSKRERLRSRLAFFATESKKVGAHSNEGKSRSSCLRRQC